MANGTLDCSVGETLSVPESYTTPPVAHVSSPVALDCHPLIKAAFRYKQVFMVKKATALSSLSLHGTGPHVHFRLHGVGPVPIPTLLTWLHFMPATGLTATSRGAPLACVKWLFTGTVHFILHRLEALCGAEIINGDMFKNHPNHLSLGYCISGWKKAKGGCSWAAQCSSRAVLRPLLSLLSPWMCTRILGLCSKCLGWIFPVTPIAVAPAPHSLSLWGTELALAPVSTWTVGRKTTSRTSSSWAGTWPSALFPEHQSSPFWHLRKDKNQGPWPFKKSFDCFFFVHIFSHLPLRPVHSKNIHCTATVVQVLMQTPEEGVRCPVRARDWAGRGAWWFLMLPSFYASTEMTKMKFWMVLFLEIFYFWRGLFEKLLECIPFLPVKDWIFSPMWGFRSTKAVKCYMLPTHSNCLNWFCH